MSEYEIQFDGVKYIDPSEILKVHNCKDDCKVRNCLFGVPEKKAPKYNFCNNCDKLRYTDAKSCKVCGKQFEYYQCEKHIDLLVMNKEKCNYCMDDST